MGTQAISPSFVLLAIVSDRSAVMVVGNDQLKGKAARLDQITEGLAWSVANAPVAIRVGRVLRPDPRPATCSGCRCTGRRRR